MLSTVKAVVREGRIELLEQVSLPEGTELLITILSDEDRFWMEASQLSLESVWNHPQDDIYEQLLEK
ncbi:MAG: hypothetical protein SF339_25405 [Blastocatellia bacterium]|nr:hypothetical protein [Blastocatellia bacterium]